MPVSNNSRFRCSFYFTIFKLKIKYLAELVDLFAGNCGLEPIRNKKPVLKVFEHLFIKLLHVLVVLHGHINLSMIG